MGARDLACAPTYLGFPDGDANFDHFEVTIDGQRSTRVAGETFEWALRSGTNTLSVASVNKFGVKGITSTIGLE